jgi:AraC-like DNA-binding protein
LLQLVGDETRHARPGRELVLERLLEVLLIEALRFGADVTSVPSVARGCRMSVWFRLRAMHGRPAHGWTVADLAAEAPAALGFLCALSSGRRAASMEYLLAWRMALAKRLLRSRELAIEHVAAQVGYGSASTFSTAFSLHAMLACRRCAMLGRWLRFSKDGVSIRILRALCAIGQDTKSEAVRRGLTDAT